VNFEFDQTDVVWLIIAAFFALSFIVQMFYYLYFYLRVILIKGNDAITSSGQPVSVVICARNEAENLEKNLPSILTQDYPDYEVVVVNDCSEDNTGRCWIVSGNSTAI
jgi:poly-beta-1,6-N-acetyl-D-glucosamine synthase